MMIRIPIFLITFLNVSFVHSQPCKQIDIKSRKERRAIKQYVRFCKSQGLFKTDSGVIQITEWKDELSQKNWDISVLTRYYELTQVPMGWAKVSDKIILYYVRPINTKLTADESICLEHIIKPYVKKLPPLPPDPKEVPDTDRNGKPRFDKDGKPLMRNFMRNITSGGNGTFSHITFKKNGSVIKQIYL